MSFYLIHGHFDQILDLGISELTLEELVNMECNVTADKALVHGVEGRDFPEEDLVVRIGDWRVSLVHLLPQLSIARHKQESIMTPPTLSQGQSRESYEDDSPNVV